MSNPDTPVLGLNAAADVVGVSPTTIHRWLRSGYFSETEAIQTGERGSWVFDYAALFRVRTEALRRGRGALKSGYIRFYDAPRGYVAARIEDIADSLLVSLMYEYADSYEALIKVSDIEHPRAKKILDKAGEVHQELLRRDCQPQLPQQFVRILQQTRP